MTTSILSESQDADVKVYQNIVSTILGSPEKLVYNQLDKLNIRGKGSLLKRLKIVVRLVVSNYSNTKLIVVVVDSDDLKYTDQTRQIQEQISKEIDFFPINNIVIGSAEKTIEAWLLSDISSINRLLQGKLKKGFGKAENINNPKGEMRKIYSQYISESKSGSINPLSYSDFLVEISSHVSVQSISHNSDSFSKFMNDLSSVYKSTS